MIRQAYQRLIIPGYESVIKGRKTFHHWRDLEQSQWFSADELATLQLERLRSLLTFCQMQSPWHRDRWVGLGLDAKQVESLEDLQRFPITTRAMMRDHAGEIRSTDPSLRFVSKATGGSSGTPLRFVIEKDANDRRAAATFRGYGWAGGAPGTRQSHLWGINLGNQPRWKRWKTKLHLRGLYRHDVLNSFELSRQNFADYVKRINRFRPRVLVAYTNPLYTLSKLILEQGVRVFSPQSIIVGAEKLHDFQREVIEDAFGSPVFETYGSREFTLIGAECERHAGLHLTSENVIVEVVDDEGQPTPPGHEGRLLVTDLFNTAMPFVRYEIGDRAVAGFQQCPCGRGLPLLTQVVGRQLDILVLPDGKTIPGEFFPHLIKDYAAIEQFQVIQTHPGQIEVKLVVDDQWNDGTRNTLGERIRMQVGPATQVRLVEVDQIPLTNAGKLRVVIGLDQAGSGQRTRVAG